MDSTVTSELPVFPMRRTHPFDIAPEYSRLRTEQPIAQVRMPNGELAWLVTRYEYVRQLLTDPRVSADRTKPGYPLFPGIPSRQMMRENFRGGLMGMDPPAHTDHRRLLIAEFTVQRVRSLRPRIQQIVDACIANTLAAPRPVDLVQTLSLPAPSHVICDLLGMPYADRVAVDRRTKTMLSRAASTEEKGTAAAELRAVFEQLVIDREENPGDDLLSRLIAKYRDASMYDRELMARMAGALLSGGHETTANMISLGAVALLTNPDQLAEIKRDPSLMPGAVEELLRYFTPLAEFTGYRAATADIEIGGVLIRAGDGIIAHSGAANRDAEVFASPDTLATDRGARHHVAFGYGAHQCLGQNLARLELEIALTTLFQRIPDLRLAVPVADVPFKDQVSIYGIHTLPVTW
jgi:cytochrome P450